jgi:hypothetical protein
MFESGRRKQVKHSKFLKVIIGDDLMKTKLRKKLKRDRKVKAKNNIKGSPGQATAHHEAVSSVKDWEIY